MYNNESTRLLIKVTSDKNELLLRVRVFVWFGWYLKLSQTIIVLIQCNLTGNQVIELLLEEYRTWDGELMDFFGFLFEVENLSQQRHWGKYYCNETLSSYDSSVPTSSPLSRFQRSLMKFQYKAVALAYQMLVVAQRYT